MQQFDVHRNVCVLVQLFKGFDVFVGVSVESFVLLSGLVKYGVLSNPKMRAISGVIKGGPKKKNSISGTLSGGPIKFQKLMVCCPRLGVKGLRF